MSDNVKICYVRRVFFAKPHSKNTNNQKTLRKRIWVAYYYYYLSFFFKKNVNIMDNLQDVHVNLSYSWNIIYYVKKWLENQLTWKYIYIHTHIYRNTKHWKQIYTNIIYIFFKIIKWTRQNKRYIFVMFYPRVGL